MRAPHRLWLGAGAALAAGLLSTATARADDGIVIDFIRHAQSGDMAVINTMVEGPHLTETGYLQADALAVALRDSGIDGIWASTMVRSAETAEPLAKAISEPIQGPLPGLNEIDAGIFEGAPVNIGGLPLGGALYLLAPALWTLGFTSVPEFGSTDANGIVFDARVDDAIATIFAGSNGGDLDAVFSHEGTIAIWALMNVDNPDFGIVLNELFTKGELLPYTGQVEISGSPGDWTLISWDGQAVPQDPGLLTDLFVDFRNLIEAPQQAGYDISQALLTGDVSLIESAIHTGIAQIDAAAMQFPMAVFDDIVGALGGG